MAGLCLKPWTSSAEPVRAITTAGNPEESWREISAARLSIEVSLEAMLLAITVPCPML